MLGCWGVRVLGWGGGVWLAHGQRITLLVKQPGTTTSSPSASTMERRGTPFSSARPRWSSAIFKTELN